MITRLAANHLPIQFCRWTGVILPRNQAPSRMDLVDRNHDGQNEICIWSKGGQIWYLDFQGNIIEEAIGVFKRETTFELIKE